MVKPTRYVANHVGMASSVLRAIFPTIRIKALVRHRTWVDRRALSKGATRLGQPRLSNGFQNPVAPPFPRLSREGGDFDFLSASNFFRPLVACLPFSLPTTASALRLRSGQAVSCNLSLLGSWCGDGSIEMFCTHRRLARSGILSRGCGVLHRRRVCRVFEVVCRAGRSGARYNGAADR